MGRYNRGLALYDMRQYDRAIREFDHAVNAKPDYAPAFNSRGLAYAAIGETRRSLQDFDQAIRLDQGLAKAFVHRGNIHQGAHRYDLALADYNAKDAYSLYSRGLTKRALGQHEAAERDIAKAKQLEPGIGP